MIAVTPQLQRPIAEKRHSAGLHKALARSVLCADVGDERSLCRHGEFHHLEGRSPPPMLRRNGEAEFGGVVVVEAGRRHGLSVALDDQESALGIGKRPFKPRHMAIPRQRRAVCASFHSNWVTAPAKKRFGIVRIGGTQAQFSRVMGKDTAHGDLNIMGARGVQLTAIMEVRRV